MRGCKLVMQLSQLPKLSKTQLCKETDDNCFIGLSYVE